MQEGKNICRQAVGGRIANGCYHIHHIEVVNMDRGWYGTYTLYGKKID